MLKQVIAAACALIAIGVTPRTTCAAGKDLGVVPTSGELAHQKIYSGSYALLIGINDYPNLPRQLQLHFAVADAESMRDVLVKYYGFPADHIRMLLNGDATKENIDEALSDFADQDKYHTDDRVLVYFSGHGQTVSLPGGGEMGFLIPSNAKVELDHIDNAAPYLRSCIEMEEVWDYLQSTPAKHVLLIADACYSGLLTQTRSLAIAPGALAAMASRRALQVMTAGGKGETSMELDQYGHGAFTYKLIEELKARAAEGAGSVFTSSELYAAVERSVSDLTNGGQDPQFGNYKTEGNFLFITTKPQSVPAQADVADNDTPPQPEPQPDTEDITPPPAVRPQVHKPATHAKKKPTAPTRARTYNAEALDQLSKLIENYSPGSSQAASLLAQAKQALDDGADPNGIVSEGTDREPVIIKAASYDFDDAVKLLIQYGANANVSRDGTSILDLCDNDAKVILIAHGAHK
jgi:hypothetical protein